MHVFYSILGQSGLYGKGLTSTLSVNKPPRELDYNTSETEAFLAQYHACMDLGLEVKVHRLLGFP